MASKAASSSSSLSTMSRRNYGVFLSFRGPDSRNTIISHLYNALQQKGVYVFKDNEELEAGQRRAELFDAIEGSRVAVVTFSENYACSRWCLDELKKIMECKDQGRLAVLPIFYRVSPGEVRLHEKENGQKGCYQAAMEEMEAKYGKDSEMVKGWRKALWAGGDLIGIPLSQGQDEGSVVKEVVEKVLKKLNRVPLEVAKYPVGISQHLKAIRPVLHIDPHADDVYMLGVHGQGGTGKTTISKAICNDIADRFDDWCFLPNVRETTSRAFNGLAILQQILLRELLRDKDLTVSSVDTGKQLIKERLCNKRVLVILDDVDELDQFDALAGKVDWFGKGSRIIITTRNHHLLTSDRVQHVYEVKLLDKEEAGNLFRLHAFGERPGKIKIDRALIDRFVEYAGELPLALVVLGAYLRDRSASEWEGKLKELTETPDVTINSVLKISLDGLEDKQKEIFLDIACFFKGWNTDTVEKILDGCGFATSLGITILVERCLVTVDRGKIQMHDLLVAMGQSVVRDDYLKGTGIPSRIWLYEDFEDILSDDTMKERHEVKGIVLDLAKTRNDGLVKANALKGFKKLRILIVRNVAGPEEPLQLPRELRWLEWRGYSAPSIEFNPSSKIVGLDLTDSKITQVKGKGFKELKYLNLSSCFCLDTLPDLSKSTKLEDLELRWCSNLTSIDEAVGSLDRLIQLDLEGCHELATVPSSLRSKRLRVLEFSDCFKLEKLPAIKEELQFLCRLTLTRTSIKELPESIGNLVAVIELLLSGCEQLSVIPSSIYKLRALERLYLKNCSNLEQFPRRAVGVETDTLGFPKLVMLDMSNCRLKDLEFLNDVTCFETLKELYLSRNDFACIPACIGKFKNLEEVELGCCECLVDVPELPNILKLRMNGSRELKAFPSLFNFICQLPRCFFLELFNCLGLDRSYIDRSLPLERVRGFVGEAEVVYPGEQFPQWLNFQSTEHDSCYQAYLPENMLEDDLLGLTFFITFDSVMPLPEDSEEANSASDGDYGVVVARAGGVRFMTEFENCNSVHTFFVYIPRLAPEQETEIPALDWSEITFKFGGKGVQIRKWGLQVLCKREQDEQRIVIRKVKTNEGNSSGSDYDSAPDCLCETDYESAFSEW